MKLLKLTTFFFFLGIISSISAKNSLDSIWGEWEVDLSSSFTNDRTGLKYYNLVFLKESSRKIELSSLSKGRRYILGDNGLISSKLQRGMLLISDFKSTKAKYDTAYFALTQTDFFNKIYIEFLDGSIEIIATVEIKNDVLQLKFYNKGILMFRRAKAQLKNNKVRLTSPLLIDVIGSPKQIKHYTSSCRSCASALLPFKEENYTFTYVNPEGLIDSSESISTRNKRSSISYHFHRKKKPIDSVEIARLIKGKPLMLIEKISQNHVIKKNYDKKGSFSNATHIYFNKKNQIDSTVVFYYGGYKDKEIYSYSRSGKLREIQVYEDDKLIRFRLYFHKTFDEYNNWLEREVFIINNESSVAEIKNVSVEKRVLEYY